MADEKKYLEQWRAKVGDYRRILQAGISHSPLDEESFNPVHVINNVWQRTLAQAVGYDYGSKEPILLASDSQGRLITTLGGVPVIVPSIGVFAVGIVAVRVAQAIPGRAYVILENVSATDVTVGTSNAVVVGAGLVVRPNQVIPLDAWVNELWAICAVGVASLAVVER